MLSNLTSISVHDLASNLQRVNSQDVLAWNLVYSRLFNNSGRKRPFVYEGLGQISREQKAFRPDYCMRAPLPPQPPAGPNPQPPIPSTRQSWLSHMFVSGASCFFLCPIQLFASNFQSNSGCKLARDFIGRDWKKKERHSPQVLALSSPYITDVQASTSCWVLMPGMKTTC